MSAAAVLIVGCGPAGSIIAHESWRCCVACRLVDKRPTPQSSTRAYDLAVELVHGGDDKKREAVHATCSVGADGARSTVRRALRLSFVNGKA